MTRHSTADPTGQGRNRQAAARELRTRLGRAQRRTLSAFRALPRTRRRVADIAVNLDVYEYEYDAETFAALLAFILSDELTPGDTPVGWYWEGNIEQSYRQGTLEAVNQLNQDLLAAGLVGVLVVPIEPQQVLLSQVHRDAVADAVADGFQAVKGMSERTARQLQQTVTNGIRAGNTPTQISAAIRKRFAVAASSADRIAATEINRAFTNAKMAAGRLAQKQTGQRVGVMHVSALLPTTRDEHAARHSHVGTMEDQLSWWSVGARRINCKCDIENVLIDGAGNMIDTGLRDQLRGEKEFFQRDRAEN